MRRVTDIDYLWDNKVGYIVYIEHCDGRKEEVICRTEEGVRNVYDSYDIPFPVEGEDDAH